MGAMRRERGTGSIYQRKDGYWVGAVELPPAPNGKRRQSRVVRKRRSDVVEAMRDLSAANFDDLAKSIAAFSLSDGFDPHGWYVYLLWGESTTFPLYVGQSSNVLARLGSHMADVTKRAAVRHVSLIACETRQAMDLLESRLIRTYRAEWNVRGVA